MSAPQWHDDPGGPRPPPIYSDSFLRWLVVCAIALVLVAALAAWWLVPQIWSRGLLPGWPTLHGKRFFEGYRASPIVINMWAVWCEPCRDELPELAALARARPDIAVVVVNADGPGEERLREDAEKLGIYPPLIAPIIEGDPFAELALPRTGVLPTTYIIGRRGRTLHTLTGPQTAASLERLLPPPL